MKLPSIFGMRGARDKPKDSYGGSAYSFFFGRSTSGKNVNERTAMQTTAVYSCVRILAEAVASLPIHVYRYTETGKERVYDHPLYYTERGVLMALGEWKDRIIIQKSVAGNDKAGNHILSWQDYYTCHACITVPQAAPRSRARPMRRAGRCRRRR